MSPYGASRPQRVNYFVAKPGMPLTKLGFTMSSPGICAIDRSLYLMKDSNHLSLPKCNEMMETHYNDVIMSAMASQITGVFIVNSTVSSGADQRKHQSSASLAFVWGIHRWTVNSPHKGLVMLLKNVSIWWRHHALGQSYDCLSASEENLMNMENQARKFCD